jgi:hypothetical protein
VGGAGQSALPAVCLRFISACPDIVPLIIRTHTLGTSFDPTTGIISTAPGEFTSDPTDPQSTCLTAPNNVPLTLFEQSPLLTRAAFTFGAVNVGLSHPSFALRRRESPREASTARGPH